MLQANILYCTNNSACYSSLLLMKFVDKPLLQHVHQLLSYVIETSSIPENTGKTMPFPPQQKNTEVKTGLFWYIMPVLKGQLKTSF